MTPNQDKYDSHVQRNLRGGENSERRASSPSGTRSGADCFYAGGADAHARGENLMDCSELAGCHTSFDGQSRFGFVARWNV